MRDGTETTIGKEHVLEELHETHGGERGIHLELTGVGVFVFDEFLDIWN